MKKYLLLLILLFGCHTSENKNLWHSKKLDTLISNIKSKKIFDNRTIMDIFDEYSKNRCRNKSPHYAKIRKRMGFDFKKFTYTGTYSNHSIFKKFNVHLNEKNNIVGIDALGEPTLAICFHNATRYKYAYYWESDDEEDFNKNVFILVPNSYFLGFDNIQKVWLYVNKKRGKRGFLESVEDISNVMILDENLYPLARLSFDKGRPFRLTKMMYKNYYLVQEISYEIKNNVCLSDNASFTDIINIIQSKGNVIAFLQPQILPEVRNIPSWLCQRGHYEYDYEE